MQNSKNTPIVFALFLILFLGLSNSALALEDCSHLAEREMNEANFSDILSCLEKYGNDLLLPGQIAEQEFDFYFADLMDTKSAIPIEKKHPEDAQQYTSGIHFDKLDRISLANQFKIRLTPRAKRIDGKILDGQCFDLSKMKTPPRWSIGSNNWYLIFIEKMQEQLVEMSKFLGNFHARALGQKSSILFQPRRISFCDQDQFYYSSGQYDDQKSKRRMMYNFEDETLYFGINSIYSPEHTDVLKVGEIESNWNNGDIIRIMPNDIDYHLERKERGKELVEKYYADDRDQRKYGFDRDGKTNEKISEVVAKYWAIINPNGALRTFARTKLTGIIHKHFYEKSDAHLSPEAKVRKAKKEFEELISSFGGSFDEGNIEIYESKVAPYPERVLAFRQRYEDYARSATSISHSIESAVTDSIASDHGMILQLQTQDCTFAITNNHTIAAAIKFLRTGRQPGATVSEFDPELNKRIDFKLTQTRDEEGRPLYTIEYNGTEAGFLDAQINLAHQEGFVCTNTADKIKAELSVPNIDPDAYRAFSMNSILNEIDEDPERALRYVQALD